MRRTSKTAAVATLLAVLLSLLWASPVLSQTAPATVPGASAPAASAPAVSATATPTADWAWTDVKTTQLYLLGSQDPKSGYNFELQLTNSGAAIYTAKLAKFYATAADKRLAEKLKDDQEYRKQVAASAGKYRGHYSLLNPVKAGIENAAQLEAQLNQGQDVLLSSKLHLPYITNALTVKAADMPDMSFDLGTRRWKVLDRSETNDSQTIRFVCVIARRFKPTEEYTPVLQVIKTYTVKKGDYSVGISLQAENLSGQPMTVAIDQAGPTGVPREDVRSDLRKLAFGRLQDQKVNVLLQDINDKDRGNNALIGSTVEAGPVLWIGQTNKFFGTMMYLQPLEGDQINSPRPTAEYYAYKIDELSTSRTYMMAAKLSSIELPPRKARQVNFNVFIGPKDRQLFDQAGTLYNQLNYMGTIELTGGCFCSFGWLALAIMWLLEHLAIWVSFGNYGVAIIILVIIVRVILHPLTKKSQVSMMKMQKLQPKLKELQEKYKDDKDTLQRETMKFYKEQGAGPLLGCLPMFLQMPIWIALYAGLGADVSLRNAAFLPIWITDLAGMDAIIQWAGTPIHIPFLDGIMGPIVSLNLLPILLTVAMYYQTKLTPTSMGVASSPQQAQQQKMMRIMTPVMMLLFFYNAPAGLNLYVMTSTFSSVFEQIIIRRHIEQRQAAEEASEATVRMPGKGPRGGRAKKPKGPGWFKHG